MYPVIKRFLRYLDVERDVSPHTLKGYREDLGAWTSDYRFSESNHRAFYGYWAKLMHAKTWEDLPA